VSRTTAPDPTTQRVEAVLHGVVGGALELPCQLARSVRRAALRPVELVRTIASLAEARVRGPRSSAAAPAGDDRVERRDEPGPPAPERAAEVPRDVRTAPPLAIEDYDSLAASQVVARLERLDDDDLAAIAAHEAAHRGRRTVLGKIDQLLAARPVRA